MSDKKIEVEYIDIDLIKPNEWNPNEEDEKKFNLLVESIREDGFIQPINVVDNGDGTYTIISGEHRWKAAKVLGYEEVPAVVHKKEEFDIDKQKFLTVRMNVLQGKLNPLKLADLVNELEKKYDKEVIKNLMGFTDEAIFEQIFKDVRESLPEEIREKLDEVKDEIKTVEGLSQVVNRLLAEYGEKIPTNFIFFVLGGKKHVMIQSNKKLFDRVSEILKEVKENNLDVNEVFLKYLGERNA